MFWVQFTEAGRGGNWRADYGSALEPGPASPYRREEEWHEH